MAVAQRHDGLGRGVFEHGLIGALGEARRVVDAVSVIVNVCAALVSAPLLAMPPLSCSCTVTVAVPLIPTAGV